MLSKNLLPKWLPQISTLDKQLKILLQFFTFLSRIFITLKALILTCIFSSLLSICFLNVLFEFNNQDISSVLIIPLTLFTCIFDLAVILFGEI